MKMKLQDALFLYETLNKIADMSTLGDAPIEVKFALVRNARAVQSFHADFMEQRAAVALANSSPKDDDSDDRTATREQVEFINQEVAKLCAMEVEVPVIPLTLKELEPLKLDMVSLSGLYPIIVDGKV